VISTLSYWAVQSQASRRSCENGRWPDVGFCRLVVDSGGTILLHCMSTSRFFHFRSIGQAIDCTYNVAHASGSNAEDRSES
jgi:hypothetical protein